ncbi:hypothetical protein ACFL6W_03650 [Thermodesulfobacteriota bacterium]
MNDNIPEEILEKLEIIEKEAIFTKKNKPTSTRFFVLVLYILGFAGGAAVAIHEKDFYQAGFFILLGGLFFITHFQNKEIYKLHSNACDIINYYRNRGTK